MSTKFAGVSPRPFARLVRVEHRVIFIGQVRPQAGNWYFDEPIVAARDDEKIQIIIQESVFNVRIDTQGPANVDDEWLERVWLRCLAIVRAALDTLGFHQGASLEVERLTAMIDDRMAVFFKSSQPRFRLGDSDRVEGEVVAPFFTEAVNNPAFRHALADVRLAQSLDDDAAFNCYRAIEGLRQSFVLPGESVKSDKAKSWGRLRSALSVTEEQIGAIADAAQARRHGGDDTSEIATRLEHVQLTRELIVRFVNQLPKVNANAVPNVQSGQAITAESKDLTGGG